jgi:hypothetical protein
MFRVSLTFFSEGVRLVFFMHPASVVGRWLDVWVVQGVFFSAWLGFAGFASVCVCGVSCVVNDG